MSRVIYSEQQSLRQVTWIWFIIIPVTLFSTLSILYSFYQQIILEEPWGNEPMSDGGLIGITLFVASAHAFVIWTILSFRLTIEITSEEFRYKLFAYFTDWNILKRHQVASYSVEKYTFWKGGLGIPQ